MAKQVTCKTCNYQGYWAQTKAGKWYIAATDGAVNLGATYGMRAVRSAPAHDCDPERAGKWI